MSAHTPKPWHIEEQWHGIAIKAGKRTVARTSPWSNQEEWANARLIAAAPELLESIEQLKSVWSWERCDEADCDVCPVRDRVDAAIRDARGVEDR